jgi:hypothetical protein
MSISNSRAYLRAFFATEGRESRLSRLAPTEGARGCRASPRLTSTRASTAAIFLDPFRFTFGSILGS